MQSGKIKDFIKKGLKNFSRLFEKIFQQSRIFVDIAEVFWFNLKNIGG